MLYNALYLANFKGDSKLIFFKVTSWPWTNTLLSNALMSFCKSLFAFSFGSFVPAFALALDFAFAFAFGVAECPALIVAKPVSRISPTAFFPVSDVTLPFALTLVLAREASAPHRSRCNHIAQVTACAIAIFLLVSHPTKDPHQQTTHHNPRKDAIAGFFSWGGKPRGKLQMCDNMLKSKVDRCHGTAVLDLAVDFVDSESLIIRKLS